MWLDETFSQGNRAAKRAGWVGSRGLDKFSKKEVSNIGGFYEMWG